MEGKAFPTIGFNFLYSLSVITSHVPRFCKPKYSSAYDASQRILSLGLRRLCLRRVAGACLTSRDWAEILRQIALRSRVIRLAVPTVLIVFQPLNS